MTSQEFYTKCKQSPIFMKYWKFLRKIHRPSLNISRSNNLAQDFNFQFLWIYVMRMVETTENFEKLIVQVPRILFKMSSHRDYSSSRSSSSSRSYEDDYYPSSKRSRDSSSYSTSSSAARRSSARFRCEMCDVSVESKAIYETHLTSQDHLRYGVVHK